MRFRSEPLDSLSADGRLLFGARILRMLAYGFVSVVLVLYLVEVGLSETQIGLLLSLTLVGDTLLSLWITTAADRLGRRQMLMVGAGLMAAAGLLFVWTSSFPVLLLAAIVGVISPSGYEVGPFLAIEQAALAQTVPARQRTGVFAWYNLVASFATALGALAGGTMAQILQAQGMAPVDSYRAVLAVYAGLGLLLGLLFLRLSPAAEATNQLTLPQTGAEITPPAKTLFGLHRSQRTIFGLSALFALDSFGGGFVVQSIVSYWLYLRYGVEPGLLGGIFFAANLLSGVSALTAAWLAARIGLVNTMVFTHIPANLLLILFPLMPNLPLAITALLLRYSVSSMDVPARQAYIMAVVEPDERSAAAGITGVARTLGSAAAPYFTGLFLANPALFNLPFFLAGTLKIVYDLALYRLFRHVRPAEEVHLDKQKQPDVAA